MDKSPLCTCLMKQDLEEAADPYEFLDKTIRSPVFSTIWINFPQKN